MCQFNLNFVSYVSAKYYLNWFTVWKIIVKIQRVNFLLRHMYYLGEQSRSLTLRYTCCLQFAYSGYELCYFKRTLARLRF